MLDERLERLEGEYEDVVARLSEPGVGSDQRALVTLSKRAKELEPIVSAHRRYRQTQGDLRAALLPPPRR